MKKLFYLFMVALCATMFAACSDDDDKDPLNEEEEGGEGVITMVVENNYDDDYDVDLDVYSFKEGEIITVDWGDGSVEEFKTVLDEENYEEHNEIRYLIDIEHEYSNSNPHTIMIKGNIKDLYCYYNKLTSLDVSKNKELIYLNCEYNNLTSLNVSGCTKLTYLECGHNNLTSLDVSKNTALTYLDCGNNNLTSLDVSKNTALTYLDCEDNNLTSLDISKNKELILLDCGDNNFSSSALNKIFYDLPKGRDLTEEEFREYCDYGYRIKHSTIQIYSNPGTNTCDRSIAEKKGWDIVDRLY
ncbi:leucine-rich repeat domain-containing protein [Odoribacter lunatus]|uniref:leucine-rich repeat domain-containing protein n=1 Tax=Odoribacter lunatus TaxID=2941335 RepID=UPI0020405D2D|nr:leucine-rich repeat domain-containing protein [Odoribacter lunatus]